MVAEYSKNYLQGIERVFGNTCNIGRIQFYMLLAFTYLSLIIIKSDHKNASTSLYVMQPPLDFHDMCINIYSII